MTEQHITDEGGDLRRWRTELPNIIDDLGLDVFERALYGHYKRVCGANGGTCYESTRTTVDKIPGMSAGQVSIVRRRLAERGLVAEETQHTIHIKIIDVWELNFAYYSVKDRPNITGWTIPQLQKWINESVYHLNTSEEEDEKCLPPKQGVYEVNTEAEKCLPGKTKNKLPIKKEPIRKGGKPPKRSYLTDVFQGNVNLREGERLIQQADWDIPNPEHRQAVAAFLEASRLTIPPDGTRNDWIKSVNIHVQAYGATRLEDLYPRIITKMCEEQLTISRPGSVTNPLAALVGEMNRDDNGRQSQPNTAPGPLPDFVTS